MGAESCGTGGAARTRRTARRGKGDAKALLFVLRTRGVEVSAELEQHIMACSDPAVLGTLLQRVATAASAAGLLATDGSTH